MKHREKPAVLATTKKETRRRLTILADYLETVPERRLDQQWYVDAEVYRLGVLDPSPSCGTSACAAGWATTIEEFQRLGLGLDRGGCPTVRGLYTSAAMCKFFGISYTEAWSVFGITPCTPKEKATQLRLLADRYK